MSFNTDSIAIQKGKSIGRMDGPLKVTGTASYSSDMHFDRLVFGVPVCSTITSGKIKKLDDSVARKMPGVLGVYSHGKIGKLYRSSPEEGFGARIDEARPPFEDEVIRYYGQYVAFVVAETFEIAKAAADSIKVTYTEDKALLDPHLTQEDEKKIDSQRGDPEKDFAAAAVKIDQTYTTPVEVHNPIEMHATVAVWDGDDKVTLYETSQAIFNQQNVLAQTLGVPKENVRVISKFLGSGFGGKLWPWTHSCLAGVTARELKRPVKVVVDRRMMFMNVGHRPHTQQNIKLGATKEGKLTSIQHLFSSQTSMLDHYKENCGESSSFLYECPNVLITSGLARRNKPTPTSMRGPGAVPGLFALESAIDELAVALNMDPVQLRLLNDTLTDGSTGHPFSSRHLKECLQLGAKKFGWDQRTSGVGSMKKDGEVIGFGVSACAWNARTLDCDAVVELHPDGTAQISCATQDIGTGTYTVLTQIVHQETGIELSKIKAVLGDTNLPPGPISGGSMATGSIVPAAVKASHEAVKTLLKAAGENPFSPFHGSKPDELEFKDGHVSKKGSHKVAIQELMTKLNMRIVTGRAQIKGNFAQKGPKTMKSFGAQFVEIGWRPELARLRVRRVISIIDGGKIINYAQAKNQIEGAIIMGLGMGLFEEVHYDHTGMPVNNNLADYIMTSHADTPPELEVTFLDYPDKDLNEYGARGVGEIGLAGIASSICSAVYHATGVRVRDIPVKIEDLLPKA